METQITFLGTSQAIPTATRNHTAILMQYKDENILIDCGEGTQRQFRKAKLNPCKLTRLLVTHWHGDHILGIPGLFQTLELNKYPKTLFIYGPKGTKKFIEEISKIFIHQNKMKIEVKEVSGKFLETKDFTITAIPLNHGAPCNGYMFEEKNKLRINKTELKKLKISKEEIHKLKLLTQGKDIKINNKKISYKKITYGEKGKKIAFVLDTLYNSNVDKLIENSDLAIVESTYTSSEKEQAKEHKHMTAEQAARSAKKNKVKKLILTHLSQRYEHKEHLVLKEAKKYFPHTTIAEDLMKVEV
ncbi:MAG: ribonuclease Z [Candidatus Pacearchaeota archaeon]